MVHSVGAKKEAPGLAAAARGCGDAVAVAIEPGRVTSRGEGAHLLEPDRPIGDEIVEVLHQLRLGQDRQILQGSFLEPTMKRLVERRMRVRIRAQLRQLLLSIVLDLRARPTFARATLPGSLAGAGSRSASSMTFLVAGYSTPSAQTMANPRQRLSAIRRMAAAPYRSR